MDTKDTAILLEILRGCSDLAKEIRVALIGKSEKTTTVPPPESGESGILGNLENGIRTAAGLQEQLGAILKDCAKLDEMVGR